MASVILGTLLGAPEPARPNPPAQSAAPGGQDAGGAPVPLYPLRGAWTASLAASPSAYPAFDAVHVYIPLSNGHVTARELQSGTEVWTRPAETTIALAADGDRVIVAGATELRALRAGDGELLWRVPAPGTLVRPPLARGGWVFVALDSGTVAGLHAETGETVWSAPLGGIATANLHVDGDRLYAGIKGGGLAALDVVSGQLLWTARLDGDPTALWVLPGRVFAGTTAPWFYALDGRDGNRRWRWRIGGDVIGVVAADDLVVALMLDQSMRAFRSGNGAQQWREPLTYRPAAGPVRAETVLLVTGHGPTLRLYALADGTRVANYGVPPPGDAGGAPLDPLAAPPYFHDVPGFVGDLVVLLTAQGTLHAARRQLMPPLAPIKALPGTPLPVPSPPAAAPPEPPESPSPGG